jgi:Asp-tRNA(Asn)/Glu-tRNA(Gln) amidotransferase A subunit family amidase
MAYTSNLDFRQAEVAALAKSVRTGELRAEKLVLHALEQIKALNPMINAFVAVGPEAALGAACRIDAMVEKGQDPGPLAGIPLAVKDLEDTVGYVTSLGSEVLSSKDPAATDSLLVSRLKAAGAIVVGKTNTPELGWKGFTDNLRFGVTRNPWSTDRTPGGSSGGSAAAIAAGMVPLATGSDGGGSIRIPSAWCGITGFKPSPGRIPSGPGVSSDWRELSSKGILGNRISDILHALIPAAGPYDRDITSLPPIGDWETALEPRLPIRVAWSPTLGKAMVDPAVLTVCKRAVETIARAGVQVEEVPEVFSRDTADSWHRLVSVYNLRSLSSIRGTPSWERLDPELALSVEYAVELSAVDVVTAQDDCALFHYELAQLLEGFDLLLTPTCATQPPAVDYHALSDGKLDLTPYPFTHPFNMTKSPVASVVAGFDSVGLPVGLQLVGRMNDDVHVISATAAIEQILEARALADRR